MNTAARPTTAPVFTIALLAFDDMEALDFAGPFEVFTTASRVHAKLNASEKVANLSITTSGKPLFDVKSVAPTLDAVQARAGLRVLPDADFAAPLQANLLFGKTRPICNASSLRCKCKAACAGWRPKTGPTAGASPPRPASARAST